MGGSSGSRIRGMDWIDLIQDKEGLRAIVNAVMNVRVPQYAGNMLNI